jgi:hypothetical protein
MASGHQGRRELTAEQKPAVLARWSLPEPQADVQISVRDSSCYVEFKNQKSQFYGA